MADLIELHNSPIAEPAATRNQSRVGVEAMTASRPSAEPSAFPEPTNRRDRIIELTAHLFANKGFHNTSMREVALASGISKATLYHYFTAKEDILQSILETGVQSLLAAAEDAIQAEGTEAQLRALLRAHALNIASKLAHVKVFLMEQHILEQNPDRFNRYLAMRRRYDAIYVEIIRRGQTEGVFRSGSPRIISYGLLGIYNWMVQWYQEQRPSDLDAITSLFEEMAMNAVRA
jgi:AcrR family transcriptional regulator